MTHSHVASQPIKPQVTTEMESPNPRGITDLIFGGRDDSDDVITETEIGHATRESAYLELFHGQSHLST